MSLGNYFDLIDDLPLKGLNSYFIIHSSIHPQPYPPSLVWEINFLQWIDLCKNNGDVSLTPFSSVNLTLDNYDSCS